MKKVFALLLGFLMLAGVVIAAQTGGQPTSVADAKYVKKAGDTMTGNLVVPNITATNVSCSGALSGATVTSGPISGTTLSLSGALTGVNGVLSDAITADAVNARAVQLGTATTDAGAVTFIMGAQSGDPSGQIAMETAGGMTVTLNTAAQPFTIDNIGSGSSGLLVLKGGGASAGNGILRCHSEDDNNYTSVYNSSGQGYIKTDGSSPGVLNLQADVKGDVTCFNLSNVGDTSDGKKFTVNRRATEGNNNIDIYVDQNQKPTITTNAGIAFTLSNAMTVNSTVESTSGGFKFPDGTSQLTSAAPATNTLLKTGDTMTGVLTVEGIDVPTTKVVAFNMAGGTAPFTVASTTVVSNLNADLLDGQTGTYYATDSNLTNHTGASTAVHGLGAGSSVVGTTDAQTLTNKTLITPTIASFTNATHTHADAANGGTISHTVLTDKGTNTHTDIDNHIAASAAHGVSGNIVGTSDAQTLSNKTFTGTTTLDVVAATSYTGDGSSLTGIGGTAGNNTWTGVNTFDATTTYTKAIKASGTIEANEIKEYTLNNGVLVDGLTVKDNGVYSYMADVDSIGAASWKDAITFDSIADGKPQVYLCTAQFRDEAVAGYCSVGYVSIKYTTGTGYNNSYVQLGGAGIIMQVKNATANPCVLQVQDNASGGNHNVRVTALKITPSN